jgi:ABC-type methionine transport system ATPase subunit
MTTNDALKNKQIRVRIPKNYHQEPVISQLVSDYGLVINIRAAILGANAVGDGWFDLDLEGTNEQIENALSHLRDLELEIWDNNNQHPW